MKSSSDEPPRGIFPLPQQSSSPNTNTLQNGFHDHVEEISTPILVVGGGPVGMLLAYTLSRRHDQPCTLVEASTSTTIYPKMEFTNGRSMEIYRQLGLARQLRDLGVPEHYPLNEIFTTGLGDEGKPILHWSRPSPAEIREKSRTVNDGTFPREPYLRCSQIPVEKWLKDLVVQEEYVQSFWGWKFTGLREMDDHVLSDIVSTDGRKMVIRSHYVVGCDGGGSLVRKLGGLSSKRKDL
jgi:2-polyprenyl-6-methoxyphenol hydroxylase-like FAD-dependent oxidoreductase